ncbi:MAG: hypothetical protein ACLSHU_02900 [Oscillospiraceae bacterium]
MLEKERGIPVDYMVDRIKQALINAYRKDSGGPPGGPCGKCGGGAHRSCHVHGPAADRCGGGGEPRF